MEPKPEREIQLVVLGDFQVGKTSIIERFIKGDFEASSEKSKTTIGLDVAAKNITIDGQTVRLGIWDTAGQRQYQEAAYGVYPKCQGAIIVFDVTNNDSYNSIQSWMENIRAHAHPGIIHYILGNKCDDDRRVVSMQKGQIIANVYQSRYLECSAKSGANIQEAFQGIARDICLKLSAPVESQEVDTNMPDDKQQSFCQFC